MPSPIGLFYLNKKNDLMPIAIQLFQEPSPTNPVFFPSDPPYTWLLAKMFFNMGEAQVHQSTHVGEFADGVCKIINKKIINQAYIGLTHMLIESICVAANRNLSPSHPIFRLMAPHFIFLLQLNMYV
jgi:arachidonate 5-lipoxygenase